jgi:glyoxylase-like metal-dependent hydrolase (beta-lactamase superfamily II)
MQTWNIGGVRVSCLVDVMSDAPPEVLLPSLTEVTVEPYRSWLVPHYLTEGGQLRIAIQSFLIESRGKRIIVDTCFGNDRNLYPGVPPVRTAYLSELAKADFDRESVDIVLCTHLHHDHVGWNTMLVDGEWVPTFPNATYLIGREEYHHWQDHDDPNIDLRDNLAPVMAAGLTQFVATDHQVTEDLHLEPTPGHTPGHVSVRISSEGEQALISGDFLHHPVQVVEQEWSSLPDFDSAQATKTRRETLMTLANTDVLLIGTHFAEPTAGYVRHDPASGWSWIPSASD